MIIKDPIYGMCTIEEPVIKELLNSKPVLRIKKVSQGATTTKINNMKDYSRYEHCVGCLLLIRHLGGSLQEQIAGLLHDVPHTAFSHVIDFVYGKYTEQNYHELIKENIIMNSEIPDILRKYNLKTEYILNEQNFPLLEKKAPDLCVDRVDYTLRNIAKYIKQKKKAGRYYEKLINYNNEIIFADRESAIGFAWDYLSIDINIFCNPRNIAAYYFLADIIKNSLERGYIDEQDFQKDDTTLQRKLMRIHDKDIYNGMKALDASFSILPALSQEKGYVLKTKARYVNPKFLENGEVRYAFDIDDNLRLFFQQHLDTVAKMPKVKICISS